MIDELKIHYEENYEEAGRLRRNNSSRIEFLTTVHYFVQFFRPNSNILDVCAGGGEYAFYLANQGHEVFACDLMEKHVNIMKTNTDADKLNGIEVANALDLSRFGEGSFDVVLCMGAMYHLFDPKEREKCITECLRVLKTGRHGVFYGMDFGEVEALVSKFRLNKIADIGANGLRYPLEDIINSDADDEFEAYMEYHLATCEEPSIIGRSPNCLWIGTKN